MPFDRPSFRPPRRVLALWVAVLVAAISSAAALASGGAAHLKLGGTWSGSYSGPYSGRFTLRWTQSRSRLIGTISLSSPRGTYRITGNVTGTSIKFGAVGVGAVYSGSVSKTGLSMSGRWTSGPAGGSWKAHKLLTKSKVAVKKS